MFFATYGVGGCHLPLPVHMHGVTKLEVEQCVFGVAWLGLLQCSVTSYYQTHRTEPIPCSYDIKQYKQNKIDDENLLR